MWRYREAWPKHRTAVESGLLGAGHEVVTRPDGRELERVLVQFRPDVVVLDVMLPGRDGFALLDVVRSRSNAGVVMLTARAGSTTGCGD